jgi:hypothetical protein
MLAISKGKKPEGTEDMEFTRRQGSDEERSTAEAQRS